MIAPLYKWMREEMPTEHQLNFLRKRADGIVKMKGRRRSKDWVDPNSREDNWYHGAICEVTVARVFQVKPNLKVYAKGKGDGGFDLTLGPWKAGIKGTRIRGDSEVPPTCGLILRPDEVCCDVMILCYVGKNMDYVDIVGWVSRPRWEQQHITKDLGYGPRDFMEQENLSDIRDLIRQVEEWRQR